LGLEEGGVPYRFAFWGPVYQWKIKNVSKTDKVKRVSKKGVKKKKLFSQKFLGEGKQKTGVNLSLETKKIVARRSNSLLRGI